MSIDYSITCQEAVLFLGRKARPAFPSVRLSSESVEPWWAFDLKDFFGAGALFAEPAFPRFVLEDLGEEVEGAGIDTSTFDVVSEEEEIW